MKKLGSVIAAAAIALGMLSGGGISASAATSVPVSISSAVKTPYSGSAVVIGNNVVVNGSDASEADIGDFVKKVNAAALGKIILPAEVSLSGKYYSISGYSDNGSFYVTCLKGKYYDFFCINDNFYPYNKALDKACRKVGGMDKTVDDTPERMLKYRVKCTEPKTEEEYFNAAATLVGAWLDSLKKETGEYKLGSYTFNGKTLPTERDIVRGEGLISGGREFCCTIGFDVSGISKDSVFAEPKNSGYNKFYNYYSGALVVVRCRWENGTCRIVDYGSGGSGLTAGLTGIRTGNTAYDTLFDFYRDTKTVQKLNSACTYNIYGRYGISASSPVFMADGRIGYAVIYPRYDAKADKDGMKPAVYDNGYFDESYVSTYSSPVDYKDGEGAQTENFHETFSLVFDDYNGDGNADFALKQSASDENDDGATYEVRCMSNDLTPRSDRFSFFMAGRHEESIRLQHTDGGRLVYWSKDKNGNMVPSVEVDDYRMYSERYYLPAELRWYDDEKTVYCFFWNNTAKDVKVGGKYHVEYNKNGKWVSVTKDKTLAAVTAKAYRDTELAFDISGITRNYGEYRVVMTVSGKTVYGGFYIGGRSSSISVTAAEKTVPLGVGYVEFTVKNDGTEPVRLTNAYLVQSGKKVSGIDVDDSLILAGGEKKFAAELSKTLAVGKYTIKIPYGTKTASCSITLKKVKDAALTCFGGKCSAAVSDGKLNITLKNRKYTKDTVMLALSDIGRPEVLINNIWTQTSWLSSASGDYSLYFSTTDIAYGKTAVLTFTDYFGVVMEDPDMHAQAKQLYDYFMEEIKNEGSSLPEEYEQYKDMTFEEFVRLLITGESTVEVPPANSLYRLQVGSEYVYFVM